jgi:hypothetical protein
VDGPTGPLNATSAEGKGLLGGGRETRAPTIDATATQVLTKGEPIAGLNGRADDFSWPRDNSARPAAASAAATAEIAAAAAPAEERIPTTDGQGSQIGQPPPTAELPQVLRRVRRNTDRRRPPLSIRALFGRLIN